MKGELHPTTTVRTACEAHLNMDDSFNELLLFFGVATSRYSNGMISTGVGKQAGLQVLIVGYWS